MVAPDNEIPVGLVVVKVPPHTVLVLVATVKPVGSVSVNPTPFRVKLTLLLVMVKVRLVVPFSGI